MKTLPSPIALLQMALCVVVPRHCGPKATAMKVSVVVVLEELTPKEDPVLAIVVSAAICGE